MSHRQKRDLLRIAVAAVLFLAGLLVPDETVRLILFLLAYLTVGLDVLKEAGEGIVHGQLFDENFLMSIATLGAMVVGEYPEAVAVMLLYHVGELFQSYAVGKSRASIASLMDIRPETAAVERDGRGPLTRGGHGARCSCSRPATASAGWRSAGRNSHSTQPR